LTPSAPAAPSVGATALRLAPIALVARGVAFLVPMLIAHLFGVSPVTDAFFYALAFPSFIMVIVSNAFGTTATPAIALAQSTTPEALPRFVGATATTSALAALAVGALVLAALGPALPVLTNFPPETRDLAWWFVAELLPFMGLVGAAVILRAACEVRGRFVFSAVSPLLRGGTVMIGIVALRGPLGNHALPAAMVLGQTVEVAWYLGVLWHSGLVPIPNIGLDPRVRRALVDVLPILGGEVMVAANLVVDKGFAGVLPEGAVSHLEYADRTRFIPQTLLESTLLAVAFATWSNLLARGDRQAYASQLDQSLRWVAAWAAPPLAGLFIGRHVLVSLLYERGEFGAPDAEAVSSAFGWYVPGLWSMMLGTLSMRAHVVERRLGLVLVLGIVSVLANGVLDAVLVGPMGIDGLALASTLTWVVVPGLYVAFIVPTIRPVARFGDWAAALGIAAGSLLVAIAVEVGPGAPESLLDVTLWAAAVACFALLGAAAGVTRPPRA
jgi:putative peptidoglycan lipid II flippase